MMPTPDLREVRHLSQNFLSKMYLKRFSALITL